MKISFISFHNWETKRIGGFHKFAEAAALAGHEIVFFSFARPYYIYFKKEERLNRTVLSTLSKGKYYPITDNNGREGKILNCTWPTLRLPMPFYKNVPNRVNQWLNSHSLTPFSKFSKKFLDGTDIFVFESCEGIYLFEKIKSFYPNAKIVYRPSDPLMVDGAPSRQVEQEKTVLYQSDLVLIVNEEGKKMYSDKIESFEERVNYKILSNGVDLEKFKRNYPKPELLNKQNTALYVGARIVEWDLLIKTAQQCPDINIICVCPELPPKHFADNKLTNLIYVPGISPNDVPAWVTNCDVVIIPNPKGLYKIKPWGITAKYYQAMAAGKPIVAFDDTDELKKYDICVSHKYENFISDIKSAMEKKERKQYKLVDKSWDNITNNFLLELKKLYHVS